MNSVHIHVQFIEANIATYLYLKCMCLQLHISLLINVKHVLICCAKKGFLGCFPNSCTGCICSFFLHALPECGLLGSLSEWLCSYTGDIYILLPRVCLICDSSMTQLLSISSYKYRTHIGFLDVLFFHVHTI